MLRGRKHNINGLELDGSLPISPRTLTFLQQHRVNVQQENGFIQLSGSFSINRAEVDAFLLQKQQQDAATATARPKP